MLLKMMLPKLRAEALAPHHHSQFSCVSEHRLLVVELTLLVGLAECCCFSDSLPLWILPTCRAIPSVLAFCFWVKNSGRHMRRKPLNWASHNTCSAVSFITTICVSLEDSHKPLKAKADDQMTRFDCYLICNRLFWHKQLIPQATCYNS